MAATVDTEWQERVLALKAEGMSSAEIAEAVGKHAATVRKVIARAKESTNGHGPIEGQTPDHLPPEDDPEHPDTARRVPRGGGRGGRPDASLACRRPAGRPVRQGLG
jgi:hypothetical protein